MSRRRGLGNSGRWMSWRSTGRSLDQLVYALRRKRFSLSHREPVRDFDVVVLTYAYFGRELVLDLFSGAHPYLAQVVGRAKTIRGIPGLGSVEVASPEDLVVLKFLAAASEPRQDLMDAKELLKRNPSLDQHYLCTKVEPFKSQTVYRRVRKSLGSERFSI
jgi:hypothetical protein